MKGIAEIAQENKVVGPSWYSGSFDYVAGPLSLLVNLVDVKMYQAQVYKFQTSPSCIKAQCGLLPASAYDYSKSCEKA